MQLGSVYIVNTMGTTVPHYSEIEVQDFLSNLGDADIARLLQIFRARGCSARAGLSNHDVLNHAINQILSHERTWPRDVSTISYLANSGRSIISNEESKRSKLIVMPTIDELSEVDAELLKPENATNKLAHSAAEIHIEQAQSNNIITEWINKIHQLFEEDQDAICFIKEKLAEQKKSKILVLCEFTDQVYRNVEKRIKDKVRKRFPNGLPWWEIES